MARQRTIWTFCVSLALWPLSPGRKIVVSFKRKLNMVFLVKSTPQFSSWALEEARPTLVLSSFFVSCEEKDYYRVVSVGQLDFDYRSYCGYSHRRHQANHFFAGFFSVFESGGITKHLVVPLGKQWILFPLDPQCLNIEGLRQNSLFPLEPVI